jgi:Type II secretion system (T2SS), protein G
MLPMDDLSKPQEVLRTACRQCGATIDPKAPTVRGLCSACSGLVTDTRCTRAAARTLDPGQFEVRACNRAPRARAALAELVSRGGGSETPIDGEVLEAGKTLISLVALIPLVGPYFIYRSLVHRTAEKYRLAWMSIAVTGFAATWLILQLPTAVRFDPHLRTRLESELNALGALAEQYRLEHGDFPDVASWRHLADREDPRFYDPWGRAYRYERTADGVTIRTLGRDGVDGGMGMDADLSAHFSPRGR